MLSLLVAAVSVSGGSLVWPRLTSAPRPTILQQVHDVVIQTPTGAQAASVLGVADEAHIEPLNGSVIVGGAVGALKDTAQKRVQTILMAQLTQQLSEDQKQELQKIVCTPEEQ